METPWFVNPQCPIFKNDRADILVRHPHFHRDWKVSAIPEAPSSGPGASLKGGEEGIIFDKVQPLL